MDSYDKVIEEFGGTPKFILEMCKDYPEDIPLLETEYINHILSFEDDCQDNFRYCNTSNKEAHVKYMEQYYRGCCGFLDYSVYSNKTGQKYKIGLNYGH